MLAVWRLGLRKRGEPDRGGEAGKECTANACNLRFAGFGEFSASPTGALYGLIFIETLLLGGGVNATGLLENPFKDGLKVNDPYPGGRFDPFNYANKDEIDLDMMKIRELKHGRLAMLAWLGILGQLRPPAEALTNAGPPQRRCTIATWSTEARVPSKSGGAVPSFEYSS